MATRIGCGEIRLASFIAHPPKPPIRRKDLGDIFYRSRIIAPFVSNFVAMATRVSRSKILLAAFDVPTPKTPYAKISQISNRNRVIAYYVPNFVAMATRKNRDKISLAALDGPTLKTPL